jgi:hypothetical protein
MPEKDEFPQEAPVTGLPAADVQAPQTGEGNQVIYTYPIHQPEEEFNDFQVGARASMLKRARKRLNLIINQSISIWEVLLCISSVSLGAVMSAIIAGIKLASWKGIMFYVVLPMVAVGTGVGGAMHRSSGSLTSKRLAREAFDNLPDPERSIEVKNK